MLLERSLQHAEFFLSDSSIALCLPGGAALSSESFSSRLFPYKLQAKLQNKVLLPPHPHSPDI